VSYSLVSRITSFVQVTR